MKVAVLGVITVITLLIALKILGIIFRIICCRRQKVVDTLAGKPEK
jgi:hypothetical protein